MEFIDLYYCYRTRTHSADICSYYVLIIKPTRCTYFSNLFLEEALYVSDSSSVHHQEFFTVHTAMLYVIQSANLYYIYHYCVQWKTRASCQQTCMAYTIAVCAVKNCWWWTEELSKTCKVSSKNKFEKLVHLVGFIIRIFHDTRSPERQITRYSLFLSPNSRL